MVHFTLRIHLAKLKLLVPLHTSNHKLYLKITGQDESKIINAPQISNELITKNNGVIIIHEDLEFKLNQGCNKISVYVYATRTFKEDILLFFNDISLRKPLSTEQIVKIECKLYNSDKIHVANLYIEMQRKGAVMPQNDFMSDITQRLNIESTKLIKEDKKDATPANNASPGFFASLKGSKKQEPEKLLRKNSKRNNSTDAKSKGIPSSLEITQQLFAIPQLGFNMQDHKDKAIPGFDPFLLGDNFQRFLRSLDYPVAAYEYMYKIVTIENSKESFFVILLISNLILFYEWALALSPLAVVIFTFYNFYKKREFEKPKVDYVKNMRFIQLLMGQISDMIQLGYEFTEDFLYWKQPDKAIILIKEAIKLPLVILFGIYYVNIRYVLILALWGGTLSNSPFCVTLLTIVFHKTIEAIQRINSKVVQEFILRKKEKIVNFEISLPFSSLWGTIGSYFSRKTIQRQKSRPRYERQQSLDEKDFSDENPGEEHSLQTPLNRLQKSEENLRIKQKSENDKLDPQPSKIVRHQRQSSNLNKDLLELPQVGEKKMSQSSSSMNLSIHWNGERVNANSQKHKTPPNNQTQLADEFISVSDNEEVYKRLKQNEDDDEYEEDEDTPMPEVNFGSHPTKSKADKRMFVTYENQRWWLSTWTNTLLPGERSNWSDKDGYTVAPKDSFKLPGSNWEWEDIWHVEKSPEFTDDEGWSYAVDFKSPFHKHYGIFDVVRKRKWIRVCKKKEGGEEIVLNEVPKVITVSKNNTPIKKQP